MTLVLVELVVIRAGNYTCRVGCGQSFLTETAREAHEETCNGGEDLASRGPLAVGAR